MDGRRPSNRTGQAATQSTSSTILSKSSTFTRTTIDSTTKLTTPTKAAAVVAKSFPAAAVSLASTTSTRPVRLSSHFGWIPSWLLSQRSDGIIALH